MVHNCLHHKAPWYLMDYCIPISDVASWRHFVLPGVITSLCLHTVSACIGVGHLLLPAQLAGTLWAMICVICCLALTVSDICLKLGCFNSTIQHIRSIVLYVSVVFIKSVIFAVPNCSKRYFYTVHFFWQFYTIFTHTHLKIDLQDDRATIHTLSTTISHTHTHT